MELVLKRCTIRTWQPSDAASLARHADNRRIWRNLRDAFPHPYTPADARAWIAHAAAARPETHFAIVVSDEAAGGIGIELKSEIFRRTAEIGFWLGEEYWSRGIMTEALRAMTDFAFEHFDLCRIEAGVFEWNPGSMRVLEKAGYTREARFHKRITKDGQTIDQMVYAVVKE